MTLEPWRDLSLLTLFKHEVNTQTELLSLALTNVHLSGPNPQNMAMLRTSAHAIKGAARIVNLTAMSQTAGALEQIFERDLERVKPYPPSAFSLFERAIALFSQVTAPQIEDPVAAATTCADAFATLLGELARLAAETDERPAPADTPSWITAVQQNDSAGSGGETDSGDETVRVAPHTLDDQGMDAARDAAYALASRLESQPQKVDPDLSELAAQLGLVLPPDSLDEAEVEPDFATLALDPNWAETGADDSEDEETHVDLAALAATIGLVLPADPSATNPSPASPPHFDSDFDDEDEAETSLDLAAMAAAAGIILPESEGGPADDSWADPHQNPNKPENARFFDWSESETPQPEASDEIDRGAESVLHAAADLSMLDLFRTEAETHTALLVGGLLDLERQPEKRDAVKELMRAAHSLKVAASIVQFPILVDLAHGMEDKLVAVQKGQLQLQTDTIDLLLAGVDVFAKLIEEPDERLPAWLQHEKARIVALTQRFRADRPALPSPKTLLPDSEGRPADGSGRGSGASGRGSGSSGDSEPQPREQRRHVRISAEKLDRLMAVSSQFFVATRALDKFAGQLGHLKAGQQALNEKLQRLEARLSQQSLDPRSAHDLREARNQVIEANREFADCLPNFTQETSQLIQLSNQLHHTVISSRMTPFGEGLQAIPRMVRDLARLVGKKVNLEIRGKGTEADRDIIEKLLPPLKHLVRNALDHGIETPEERRAAGKDEEALLLIDAHHQAGMLTIMVEDDGRGVNYPKLREKVVASGLAEPNLVARLSEKELLDFLFLPGFSTAEKVSSISGRGVGLDVVYSMVHEIGGSLRAASQPGRFMRIQLNVPVTLSVVRTLILEIEHQPYAVPLAKIRFCSSVDSDRIFNLQNRRYLRWEDENVALIDAREILGLPKLVELPAVIHIVFFQLPDRTLGLIVDRFLGHRHLVVRPIDERIGEIPDINAAAIMEDGRVVLIFHADDLMQSLERCIEGQLPAWQQRPRLRHNYAREKLRILVVDDSATVREVQRQILEEQGYQVDLAEDGVFGLKALAKHSYDLVISDVDMPRLNGLKFIQKIRANPQLSHLPVLMVSYRDSDGDRTRGLDAGADAYLTKNDLYSPSFIATVQDLLDRVTTRH